MNPNQIRLKPAILFISLIIFCLSVGAQSPKLYKAIKKGDMVKVKEMITNDNINTKDKSGKTPLIYATEQQQIDIVKFLIDSGADVFIENSNKQTPWQIAQQKGNSELATILVEENNYQLIIRAKGMGGYEFYLNQHPNGKYVSEIETLLEAKRIEMLEHEVYLDTLISNKFANVKLEPDSETESDIYESYAQVKLILTVLENHISLREKQSSQVFSEYTTLDSINIKGLIFSGEVESRYTNMIQTKEGEPYRGGMIIKVKVFSTFDNTTSVLWGNSWYMNLMPTTLVFKKGNDIFFCGNKFGLDNECNCTYGSSLANANSWNVIRGSK